MIYSAATYLINETEIKQLIPELPNNLDTRLIRNAILFTQEIKLKSIIGYEWLTELYTQHNTGSTTVENQFILDNYLDMIIALGTYQRIIYSTTYQVEQSGVRVKIVDNSEKASDEAIHLLRTQIQSDFDFLVNEMIRYIEEHITLYPLWNTRNDDRNVSPDVRQRSKMNFGFNISKIGGCEFNDYD
jgi:hypothetical protein